MEQSKPNATQGGTPYIAIPGRQASAGVAGSPSGGRLRTRSSQSEEELTRGSSYGRSPVQTYQEGKGANGVLSSSPRSPGTRGPYAPRGGASRAKLPQGPRQENPTNKENGAAKSPATPRQPAGRGRNRTSSETEKGGKGSRGPAHRKRGLSETEGRPWREKYDHLSHWGNWRDALFVFNFVFDRLTFLKKKIFFHCGCLCVCVYIYFSSLFHLHFKCLVDSFYFSFALVCWFWESTIFKKV